MFGWSHGGERVLPGEPGRKMAGKKLAYAVSAGDAGRNGATAPLASAWRRCLPVPAARIPRDVCRSRTLFGAGPT